ncbi:MAG: flagellar assembly protein FliW [Oscillospiraceae bacterium]|nr:flagellar assembly protein FliW [Oscillospiraceae bacterium]
MQVETARFGTLDIDGSKLVRFRDGIPGLEEFREFALLQTKESYPINWLQSVTDGNVALPVIDMFSVVPDYAFDLGDDDVAQLGLASPDDVLVAGVLVIPDSIEQMTINLAAPVVINLKSGDAKQIILADSEYGARVPIFAEVRGLFAAVNPDTEDADAGTVEEN